MEQEMSAETASNEQPALPAFLQDTLSRENLQRVARQAQSFAKEHPAQAAGLVAVAGLALWGLVGTKTGRQLVKTSSSLAMPIVTGWVAKNYESFI